MDPIPISDPKPLPGVQNKFAVKFALGLQKKIALKREKAPFSFSSKYYEVELPPTPPTPIKVVIEPTRRTVKVP